MRCGEGADRVAEDLDLGASFGGGGCGGGGVVVGWVREVVDGEDVDRVGDGGGGVDVDAVGDEGAGEALEGEARGGECLCSLSVSDQRYMGFQCQAPWGQSRTGPPDYQQRPWGLGNSPAAKQGTTRTAPPTAPDRRRRGGRRGDDGGGLRTGRCSG